MAIIVEDGTGKADAVAYASVQDVRDYAAARGLTVSSNDTLVEQLLVKAADFIETYRARFKGTKASAEQALQWPRADVEIDGEDLEDDVIPSELIKAQCQLAIDAATTDLMPNGVGREVIREKVDALEVEYAQRNSGTVRPEFNKAESLLQPLLKTSSGFSLTTLRV